MLEVLGPNEDNSEDYSLKIVEMDAQIDVSNLRTKEFTFLKGMKIYQDEFSKAALSSTSFEMLREKLRTEFAGEAINVSSLLDEGIYRSEDTESLLLLSAFYHLEQITAFSKKIGLMKPEAALNVGFLGQIYPNKNEPALNLKDNAIYLGAADTLILLPVTTKDGLPLAINEGVLAHEFHHRIFFEKVWLNNNNPSLWTFFQSRYASGELKRWQNLLSALDEGLADVFAVAYSKHPAYLKLSLSQEKSRRALQQRDLLGKFATFATYDNLSDGTLDKALLGLCRDSSRNFTNPNFSSYCLGTVIAKSFYEACGQNIDCLRTPALPVINQALEALSKVMGLEGEFDLHLFLNAAATSAKKINAPFHEKFCEQMRLRFLSFVEEKKIASCAK